MEIVLGAMLEIAEVLVVEMINLQGHAEVLGRDGFGGHWGAPWVQTVSCSDREA